MAGYGLFCIRTYWRLALQPFDFANCRTKFDDMAWQNAAYLHQVQYNAENYLITPHLRLRNTIVSLKIVVLKSNLGVTNIASNQAIL